MTTQVSCHGCESADLHEFEAYRELTRVTSDCKPWSAGGRLSICRTCGLIQVPVSSTWLAECDAIYRNYSVYHQSGGIEQAVFDPETGEPACRSDRLVRSLRETLDLPEKGRLVDLGCGNGGFLKAIARALPSWEFAGVDLSDATRDEVLAIRGVTDFYAMDARRIPGRYTGVSMIHVLEHVPDPGGVLSAMAEKIEDDGFLFVQVPAANENPFDLLIADHCSHFTQDSLLALVVRSGFAIANSNPSWLPKELSVVATSTIQHVQCAAPDPRAETDRVEQMLDWLHGVAAEARADANHGPIGVFGTSIAATWLTSAIGAEAVAFFVDEDPGRAAGRHLDRPVWTPPEVPAGERVFVPVAPSVAGFIRRRLDGLPFQLIVPDGLHQLG